jgi:hypothetical protein
MDLVAYLISSFKSGIPGPQLPSTAVLSEMFDCPYELITCIGWAVRNDTVLPYDLSPYGNTEAEQKFNYFQRKCPSLNSPMTGNYELLPNYYRKQTYFVRKGMAYRSPVVSGQNWMAIGNSAGFTNPLISPGINAGIGAAFYAADLTRDLFSAPAPKLDAVMKDSAARYQVYMHDFMMPRLHQMNRH